MGNKKIKLTESVKSDDGTVTTQDVDVESFRADARKIWEDTKKIDLSSGAMACRFLLLALDDENCPYDALIAMAACDEDSIGEAAVRNPKADAAVQLARKKAQLNKKINEGSENA